MEMEIIARENGCIASQAYCFSFLAPGFFQKMGYSVLGASNGYPPPVEEFYLIKKYSQGVDRCCARLPFPPFRAILFFKIFESSPKG